MPDMPISDNGAVTSSGFSVISRSYPAFSLKISLEGIYIGKSTLLSYFRYSELSVGEKVLGLIYPGFYQILFGRSKKEQLIVMI